MASKLLRLQLRAWLDSLLIAEETSYNRLTRYIGKLKDRTAIKGC